MEIKEENRIPLFWVKLIFKGYEDTMIFCFNFYFSFRTTSKRTARWKRFPSLLWYFFFESTILKLPDQAMFKMLLQQLQNTLTTAFDAINYSLRFYRHGSPHELIFPWVNVFKRKSAKLPGRTFEEHWTNTFHLLLYASFCLK